MHGGGIVRVRPDGSEIETFIHGTRNVYDVAIDPFMNVFTRENTNDGVGWWVRFSHYIQTGEYGYPSLYTNFPEDMIPAIGEFGRGSGTGNLFLQEPTWPEKYNNQALMGDWGRSHIFIHRLEKDGASFTNKKGEENFIGSKQIADLDVDGTGQMFIAAWANAGYKGNPSRGYIERVVPKNWKYVPFPDLAKLSDADLASKLKSASATMRTYAQQELLKRNKPAAGKHVLAVINDGKASLESRVAAIYTLAQLQGAAALPSLEKIAANADLKEHAIRCMADRLDVAKAANLKVLIAALKDSNPRVQVAAAVALGRTGNQAAAEALLAVAAPVEAAKGGSTKINPKPHSTPNSKGILPHIARQALIALDAQDACIAALNHSSTEMQFAALAAMKWMHSEKVVAAIIKKAQGSKGAIQERAITTLLRLHQKETPYDGSTWWQTRPNPDGPYYFPTDWEGSKAISDYVSSYVRKLNGKAKKAWVAKMKRNKAYIGLLNPRPRKVKAPKNTIGKTAIEDIVLFLEKAKGKVANGKKVINKVGCIGCHNVTPEQTIKGPDLAKLGDMSKTDLAEAIIKPGASIAPSWVTINMNDGSSHMGTLISEEGGKLVLHDIAGTPKTLKVADIKSRGEGANLMSLHLCDSLSLQEFADLVAYIQSMDKSKQ